MANITVNVAFDMEIRFGYIINLIDDPVEESGSDLLVSIPDGNTLVLTTLAGAVTGFHVLDGAEAVMFAAISPALTVQQFNETLIVADQLDLSDFIEWSLSGNDTLNGSTGVDRLYGFAGRDTINGGGAEDRLYGGSGGDTLNGGAGVDTMYGELGNDTYVVNDSGDVVSENFDEGDKDTVKSKVTYVLPQYVENLILTGALAINGTGNDDDNTLTGNSAANILNGGGGNDLLIGKGGNDSYEVDSSADTVTELAGEGTDHVLSSAATFTLAANIERLTLLGSATGGTGNELANVINGNVTLGSTLLGEAGNDNIKGFAGNDVLRGGFGNDKLTGGEGNDELHGDPGTDNLIGGLGNDEYWVEVTTDVVTEGVDAGTDTLYANFSINLANYANVENLILTGTLAINGTGTAGSNDIRGNSAINVLNGGGSGDLMYGKGGNDNLKGGGGDDVMFGDAGDDVINGGAGFDTMAGGGGADIFVFNTVLESDPNNSVIDFETTVDKLRLDQTIFTELTVGTLSAGKLVSGVDPVAAQPNDFILYNTSTGNLLYDADGNGPTEAIQFANISGGPDLVAADIIIVA